MKAKERELNKKAWKDRRFFHVFPLPEIAVEFEGKSNLRIRVSLVD